MKTELVMLDPTSELSPTERPRRERPTAIDGEERLQERGVSVRRYRKPRFSILAPPELKQQIRNECDLVIEALAD